MLVASGGLGKEVNLFLRAVSLPGSELVLPVVLNPRVRQALEAAGGWLGRVGFRPNVSGREIWRSYTGLAETRGRAAFIHTVRSVIDPLGQRVSARDRLYLAQKVPTLIVWGDRDRIIPVAHAYATHDAIPGSHLAVIPRAGHFLPFEAPGPFLDALNAFLDTTEPAHTNEDDFRSLVIARAEGDSATRMNASS